MIKKRGNEDFPMSYRPNGIPEVYGQEETKKVITDGIVICNIETVRL